MANLYLGEDDLTSARNVANSAIYPDFQTYLGASDGYVRKVPHVYNPNYHLGMSGKDIPQTNYLTIGPGRIRIY